MYKFAINPDDITSVTQFKNTIAYIMNNRAFCSPDSYNCMNYAITFRNFNSIYKRLDTNLGTVQAGLSASRLSGRGQEPARLLLLSYYCENQGKDGYITVVNAIKNLDAAANRYRAGYRFEESGLKILTYEFILNSDWKLSDFPTIDKSSILSEIDFLESLDYLPSEFNQDRLDSLKKDCFYAMTNAEYNSYYSKVFESKNRDRITYMTKDVIEKLKENPLANITTDNLSCVLSVLADKTYRDSFSKEIVMFFIDRMLDINCPVAVKTIMATVYKITQDEDYAECRQQIIDKMIATNLADYERFNYSCRIANDIEEFNSFVEPFLVNYDNLPRESRVSFLNTLIGKSFNKKSLLDEIYDKFKEDIFSTEFHTSLMRTAEQLGVVLPSSYVAKFISREFNIGDLSKFPDYENSNDFVKSIMQEVGYEGIKNILSICQINKDMIFNTSRSYNYGTSSYNVISNNSSALWNILYLSLDNENLIVQKRAQQLAKIILEINASQYLADYIIIRKELGIEEEWDRTSINLIGYITILSEGYDKDCINIIKADFTNEYLVRSIASYIRYLNETDGERIYNELTFPYDQFGVNNNSVEFNKDSFIELLENQIKERTTEPLTMFASLNYENIIEIGQEKFFDLFISYIKRYPGYNINTFFEATPETIINSFSFMSEGRTDYNFVKKVSDFMSKPFEFYVKASEKNELEITDKQKDDLFKIVKNCNKIGNTWSYYGNSNNMVSYLILNFDRYEDEIYEMAFDAFKNKYVGEFSKKTLANIICLLSNKEERIDIIEKAIKNFGPSNCYGVNRYYGGKTSNIIINGYALEDLANSDGYLIPIILDSYAKTDDTSKIFPILFQMSKKNMSTHLGTFMLSMIEMLGDMAYSVISPIVDNSEASYYNDKTVKYSFVRNIIEKETDNKVTQQVYEFAKRSLLDILDELAININTLTYNKNEIPFIISDRELEFIVQEPDNEMWA